MARLNQLEFRPCYPFLFDVFVEFENKQISLSMVISILHLLETYVIRRIVVQGATQGANKFFPALAKEIKSNDNWQQDYLLIMSSELCNRPRSTRLPDDESFKHELCFSEIYSLAHCKFILEEIENYNNDYKIDCSNLTIEHIMPQKLTSQWRQHLGDDYSETHKKYVHYLGNLSLTANNSKLSNHSISKKQDIDYQNSRLKLAYTLNNLAKWRKEDIIQRGEKLANLAIQIWSYPKKLLSNNFEDFYDLTDSYDNFTGTKPVMLYLGQYDVTNKQISSWRNVLIETCRYLHDYTPYDFMNFITQANSTKYFSKNPEILRAPVLLLEDYYIECNMSAESILNLI